MTCFIKYLRDNLSGRLAVHSNQPTIIGRHGNHAERPTKHVTRLLFFAACEDFFQLVDDVAIRK